MIVWPTNIYTGLCVRTDSYSSTTEALVNVMGGGLTNSYLYYLRRVALIADRMELNYIPEFWRNRHCRKMWITFKLLIYENCSCA